MPAPAAKKSVVPMLEVLQLGMRDYMEVWQDMQRFTAERDDNTPDQIWLVEHPPVYTLGLNGKQHHIHDAGEIPVIQVDRGGQVTYHGPGQAVLYLLIDLRRKGMGVRELVSRMEQAVIALLGEFKIASSARKDAPGVYVADQKIAALGLRVKRGCSYHGISLNVDMDLSPFLGINPCGYPGMSVTQLKDLGINMDTQSAQMALLSHLARDLGYTMPLADTHG